MKSHEVSPKALTAWIVCAMLGPISYIAARSAWVGVLVSGILCTMLCVVIHGFSDSQIWRSKLYCALLLVWQAYAGAVIAAWSAVSWPGEASKVVVPLVLLTLAAASVWNGADRASRISATLCPLCVLVFAVILACGVGNVKWERVQFSTASPAGTVLFVFLLPIAATAIPRRPGAAIARAAAGLTAFAGVFAAAVAGVLSLPEMLVKKDAFYEFTRSLDLFSGVQRFESIAAVGYTLSIYATLSLLLGGIGHLAEQLLPGSGRLGIVASTAAIAALVVFGGMLEDSLLAIMALVVWGFLPAVAQFFPERKKVKKEEKTS